MQIIKKLFVLALCFTVLSHSLQAQFPLGPEGYSLVGKMNVKNSKNIKSSSWSIGGETLDRDYADYHSYKKYLGPLGAKRIRLQGGWAKCEKVKGQYEFAWLDEVVKDAVAQHIQPWISLSYGNPAYAGGGDAKLGGGLPSSEEAINAWLKWVDATVTRYKNSVPEWEIWNEPDLTPRVSGKSYAEFYIVTVERIKKIQPNARIFALALAGTSRLEFTTDFLNTLKEKNKLNLVDVVTFHGYAVNPDASYPVVAQLETFIRSFVPNVLMMQGENGCPSTPKGMSVGALSKENWSELTQAKWNLRRMLGDFGRGIATNVFSISDFWYAEGDHMVGYNAKGLLQTYPDKTVERPKMSYAAVQRAMGYFTEDNFKTGLENIINNTGQSGFSSFGYVHKKTGLPVFTTWRSGERPLDSFRPVTQQLLIDASFKAPVYVDLVSGNVYAIPKSAFEIKNGKTNLTIPVPDYPIIIADRSAMEFTAL